MTEKSVFHITSVLLLRQSEHPSSLMMHRLSLEDIRELVFEFGGVIQLTYPSDDRSPYLSFAIQLGNCQAYFSSNMSNLSVMLQKEAFKSDTVILEKGTKLSIIDNSYFVL
jgi:hypothetical protein